MIYQRLTSLCVAALVAAASVSASPMYERAHARCRAGHTKGAHHVPTTDKATSSMTSPVGVPEAPSQTPWLTPTGNEITPDAPSSSSSTTSALPSSPATQEQAIVPAAPVESPTAASQTSNKAAAAASSSSSSSSSSGATHSGTATFYGGNVSARSPGAAWDNAAECGACVSVTGPNGKTIKAMVVDQCPECEADHLDLFQNAFTELADISKGIIDITWSFVPCGITSPLVLKNKEGTSQYWFSMQVVNAAEPVAKLEVSTDGGKTWQGTTRTSYNFFEMSSGFGRIPWT
ncbi:hypothetical protein Aspvir_004331 [Aspergillus viridinutans]|uniref:RlpA-like protein double-psi beta-barrel domain-containing protein n=1 Tax=Aspergillus viridinutans TaxID=75553 RepID=A0A9P3BXE3_ASPVI|nr:uncharacterized protein Aspvir_004331 [Aspergillus viridinutans]GIK00309.1 hypothetical protein Aspvir_004331 [Aspergillus viridinutans]